MYIDNKYLLLFIYLLLNNSDHLKFQHKKKKKVLSRKEQRKNIRHEKKTKRNEFFHNKGTPNPKIQVFYMITEEIESLHAVLCTCAAIKHARIFRIKEKC